MSGFSPLHEIGVHPGQKFGIRLFLKRDDLIHPKIEGTKWRKLQPFVEHIQSEKLEGAISFGGAFSNHLHALARAGQEFHFSTVGIVRGMHVDLHNSTLGECQRLGMTLLKVEVPEFENWEKSEAVAEVAKNYPRHLVIPPGACHPWAVSACASVVNEIEVQIGSVPTHFIVAAGYGTTAAGVISAANPNTQVIVVPVTTQSPTREDIEKLLPAPAKCAWEVVAHRFRKFAPPTTELVQFCEAFEAEQGIKLDPVYTSKMMCLLFERLAAGHFKPDSVVVALHSGGTQGWGQPNAVR